MQIGTEIAIGNEIGTAIGKEIEKEIEKEKEIEDVRDLSLHRMDMGVSGNLERLAIHFTLECLKGQL